MTNPISPSVPTVFSVETAKAQSGNMACFVDLPEATRSRAISRQFLSQEHTRPGDSHKFSKFDCHSATGLKRAGQRQTEETPQTRVRPDIGFHPKPKISKAPPNKVLFSDKESWRKPPPHRLIQKMLEAENPLEFCTLGGLMVTRWFLGVQKLPSKAFRWGFFLQWIRVRLCVDLPLVLFWLRESGVAGLQ